MSESPGPTPDAGPTRQNGRADLGLTHIALPVSDIEASIDFYHRYASMVVVHRRRDSETGTEVAWISDLTRPFVIVLITTEITHTLGGWAHVGVACESRAEVDRRCRLAAAVGHPTQGPNDDGPPVGYWSFITDPDGHNLELSYGQSVAFVVESGAQA